MGAPLDVSIPDRRDLALEFGTSPTQRLNFKLAWEFEQALLGQRLITARHQFVTGTVNG